MSASKALRDPEAHSTNRPVGRAKTGYIPTLDGWRTIAVFGVILFHSRPIILGPVNLTGIQIFGENGVQLFFAISGLLICSRLLEERKLSGRISLAGFYTRRLFRIQPAAFVYIAFVSMLSIVGILHLTVPATMSSLFCYRNFYAAANGYVSADDGYTNHFWSLAVEEHFYLLLPALLVFAKNKIVQILSGLSIIFFIWPPLASHFHLFESQLFYWRTDMALRDLLIPALLAVMLSRPSFRARMTSLSAHSLFVYVVVAALLVTNFVLSGHLTGEVICLGFPLVIMGTVLHPHDWLGRVLETRPFVFLGRISYSIYLWQNMFFIHRPEASVLRYLQRFPINIVATLVCATASYYIVEKPLMRLGHRLAPPSTPGRPDLKLTTSEFGSDPVSA